MATYDNSGWTTPAVLKEQAAERSDSVFCSFDNGKSLTYGELDRLSDRLASAMAGIGVQASDRVMVMLDNGMEILLSMMALHKRGAIFVPVNTELRGDFLEHQLRTIAPTAVVVSDGLLGAFDTVSCTDAGIRSTIIVGVSRIGLSGTAVHTFDRLLEVEARPDDLEVASPHNIATIIFTSGTTGPSKGVMLPHALCYVYALGARDSAGLTEQDRMYVSMPLFHGTALLLQFYSCLLTGIPVHIATRFSATTWLDEIRATGSTVTYAVGVMPEFVFAQPERDDDAQNPLRLVWAVPVAQRWGLAFE